MKRLIPFLCGVSAVIVALVGPAAADAQTISVFSAQIDTGTNSVVLEGSSFAAGTRLFLLSPPLAELSVTSTSPTQIRATLPASVAPGTYLLLLYNQATSQFGTFTFTWKTRRAASSRVCTFRGVNSAVSLISDTTPL